MTRHRGGFGVVEALVVIGVLLVLVALALPAVQAARESARAAQCKARFRALGVAFAQYEDAYRCLPLTTCDSIPGTSVSALARVVAYIDQPLGDLLNLEHTDIGGPGLVTPWLATAGSLRVSHFLCPSDPEAARVNGRSSHRTCLGSTGYFHEAGRLEGAFPLHTHFRPPLRGADLTDGRSSTVGAAEALVGSFGTRFDPARDAWYLVPTVAEAGNIADPDFFMQACAQLPSANPPHYPASGFSWLATGPRSTEYVHALPPNARVPDCTWGEHTASFAGTVTARSFHPGGVHALLMDGSVRFVGDGVALPVWRALGTRAGGDRADLAD